MIEVLMSLAALPVAALLGAIMLLGSILTGSLVLLGVLITAPFIIAFALPMVGPALVVKAGTSILEEHPELTALGALILGAGFGIYFLLRNGLNGKRNGNGNGLRLNGNGINGKKNGLKGKNGINGFRNGNGLSKNGARNGKK
jgi:hypothetical protein